MKLQLFSKFVITALAALTLFGCGGGGGGGSAGPVTPKAVVTIGLQGTLAAGKSIGAVDVVLTLPAGVTAVADGTGLTLSGVVVPSGVAAGALSVGNYTAASGSNPGEVRVGLIRVAGFTTGNIVTLNLDYTGTPPVPGGFNTSGLLVFEAGSTTTQITGLITTLELQVF